MRHHEPLIAMRSRGLKPAGIVGFETDGFCPEWAQWASLDPGNPRIEIEPKDAIQHLDLRFVVGLEVQVDGTDQRRVRELFAAAQDHGAARVIASVFRRDRDTFQHVEILDTKGLLTWTC